MTKSASHRAHFSKWLTQKILCTTNELASLLPSSLTFLRCGRFVERDSDLILERESLLQWYEHYLLSLALTPYPPLRPISDGLTCLITVDQTGYRIEKRDDGRFFLLETKPLIMMRPFYFLWNSEVQKLLEFPLGEKRIYWGLQFSFPQLFRPAHAVEIMKCYPDPSSPNALYFQQLWRSLRQSAPSVRFRQGDLTQTSSFRLGKEAHHLPTTHRALLEENITCLIM